MKILRKRKKFENIKNALKYIKKNIKNYECKIHFKLLLKEEKELMKTSLPSIIYKNYAHFEEYITTEYNEWYEKYEGSDISIYGIEVDFYYINPTKKKIKEIEYKKKHSYANLNIIWIIFLIMIIIIQILKI